LPDNLGATPRHLTKQEFGRRLFNAMINKGWNQSQLSRQSGVARDLVSIYIRGKSLPHPANLQKLADALGVEVAELLPNVVEEAIDKDPSSFEFKSSTSAPGVGWLRINRMVKLTTAMAVGELIAKDDTAEG
jgi:transcriptional regulator with XRE-family HTH domain